MNAYLASQAYDTYSDYLPEKTKNQVGFSFHKVSSTDVNDVATNGLSRVDCEQ